MKRLRSEHGIMQDYKTVDVYVVSLIHIWSRKFLFRSVIKIGFLMVSRRKRDHQTFTILLIKGFCGFQTYNLNTFSLQYTRGEIAWER